METSFSLPQSLLSWATNHWITAVMITVFQFSRKRKTRSSSSARTIIPSGSSHRTASFRGEIPQLAVAVAQKVALRYTVCTIPTSLSTNYRRTAGLSAVRPSITTMAASSFVTKLTALSVGKPGEEFLRSSTSRMRSRSQLTNSNLQGTPALTSGVFLV